MEKIKTREERCKGCYLCIANCKAGALSLSGRTNVKGVITVEVDQEKCIQMLLCNVSRPGVRDSIINQENDYGKKNNER